MFISSLTGVEVREYKAKEFCQSMKCEKLAPDRRGGDGEYICTCADCIHSAKVFHHWLIEQGFFVFKPTKELKEDCDG